MDDGGSFTPNNTLGTLSDSSNIMDDLLYDGFWLETTTAGHGSSNFMQPTSSTDLNSTSETHIGSWDTNPPLESLSFLNEETQISNLFHETPLRCPEIDDFSASQVQCNEASVPSVSPNESGLFLVEDTQVMTRRLWVEPKGDPISVKKRLAQAINYLKESTSDKDFLIQIWVPVKRGSRQVLTTKNQPFSVNPNCKNLAEYRDISRKYQFAADEESKELVGLPGRVFMNKLPEWTPDVRFFKRDEYPRVNHAHHHDVRGSLALPVFQLGSGNCLGVVEIVTTTQKLNYRLELQNICKALQAVDLKSSNLLIPPNLEDSNVSYQAALTEIRNVLKCVCEAHKLPLAQTWAPCIRQGKGGCRHSDENYSCCASTIDSACYVADPQVSGFHEACSEHHLLKGEGIAGKAFLTNQPCFSGDITAFSKTEYPLAHHARVFNLCASLAIRLRSAYTGMADFVLEFFFPQNCKDTQDQMLMLDSLLSVIQRTCQSLRVVMDEEFARETSGREIDSSTSAGGLDADKYKKKVTSPPQEPSCDSLSRIKRKMDSQHKGKGVFVSLNNHKVTIPWDNSALDLHHVPAFVEHDQEPKGSAECSGNFSFDNGHLSFVAKTNNEKRGTKTEKAISLQVLRQHFSGSLKDAAKSIGVCPTTLKRMCRHHGITRWPSRKIRKVGHSLRKLQLVIDSVQGAEGSIQLTSFYNNFPELVSTNEPGSSHLPTSKMSGHQKKVNTQTEGTLLSPETVASKSTTSSSGCHSSSSSHCCSTGVKQSSFPVNGSSSADALSAEMSGGILRRAQSDAELHDKGQQERKLVVRSYSHKIFSDHAPAEAPTVPTNTNQVQHDVGTFRVKAALGEEKIRFSLQPHWSFNDLRQEVLRRFNIENESRIDLKYLDDDAEWVLLTCDDDLEECMYIHRSSKSQTIKLSLNQAYYPSLGNSFGNNGTS